MNITTWKGPRGKKSSLTLALDPDAARGGAFLVALAVKAGWKFNRVSETPIKVYQKSIQEKDIHSDPDI